MVKQHGVYKKKIILDKFVYMFPKTLIKIKE